PVRKDVSVGTAAGVRTTPRDSMTASTAPVTAPALPIDSMIDSVEWYAPTAAAHCSTVDVSAARAVEIQANLYNPQTMISPDSAKIIALCAIPGQIGGGEM